MSEKYIKECCRKEILRLLNDFIKIHYKEMIMDDHICPKEIIKFFKERIL